MKPFAPSSRGTALGSGSQPSAFTTPVGLLSLESVERRNCVNKKAPRHCDDLFTISRYYKRITCAIICQANRIRTYTTNPNDSKSPTSLPYMLWQALGRRQSFLISIRVYVMDITTSHYDPTISRAGVNRSGIQNTHANNRKTETPYKRKRRRGNPWQRSRRECYQTCVGAAW